VFFSCFLAGFFLQQTNKKKTMTSSRALPPPSSFLFSCSFFFLPPPVLFHHKVPRQFLECRPQRHTVPDPNTHGCTLTSAAPWEAEQPAERTCRSSSSKSRHHHQLQQLQQLQSSLSGAHHHQRKTTTTRPNTRPNTSPMKGITKMRKLPQQLTGGHRIAVEGLKQGGNQRAVLLPLRSLLF